MLLIYKKKKNTFIRNESIYIKIYYTAKNQSCTNNEANINKTCAREVIHISNCEILAQRVKISYIHKNNVKVCLCVCVCRRRHENPQRVYIAPPGK